MCEPWWLSAGSTAIFILCDYLLLVDFLFSFYAPIGASSTYISSIGQKIKDALPDWPSLLIGYRGRWKLWVIHLSICCCILSVKIDNFFLNKFVLAYFIFEKHLLPRGIILLWFFFAWKSSTNQMISQYWQYRVAAHITEYQN